MTSESQEARTTRKDCNSDAKARPSAGLCIQQVAILDLKPDPQNPRLHSERQIKQLAKSIKAFGFVQPILIDGSQRVLAGHGRIEAAKLLGFHEIPAISILYLSDAQIRAYMIADNRLAEQSFWDEKLLGEQLKSLSEVELDFDLEATGFEMGEIDLLIEGLEPATKGVVDPADILPDDTAGSPVTRNGDLWLLNRHRVLSGNCLDKKSYEELMQKDRAAMVFADPPYNVPIAGHATGLGQIRHKDFKMASGEMSESEFIDFLHLTFSLIVSFSFSGSLHFICSDWRHLYEMLVAGRQIFSELKNICIWVKDNGGMGSFYRSRHELVFVFKNGTDPHRNNIQLGQFGRYRTNVWEYAGANSFSRATDEGNILQLHPTPKPVAMVADTILDCSTRNDIVLDPFLGSGTTVIAAERTGRVCYGMELDQVYVDTIVRRWQRFTGKTAIHASSGRTFAEFEQEASDGSK